MGKKIVVAITGASGSIYALRMISLLKKYDNHVSLIISNSGFKNIKHELDLEKVKAVFSSVDDIYDNEDIAAPLASGSYHYDSMVIIPCTINTVGMIHSSIANSLITRCALVAQKEGRNLVIVPRETPLTAPILKQLYDLAISNIKIFVPTPAFYNNPNNIEELIEFLVYRILHLIGITLPNVPVWKGLNN